MITSTERGLLALLVDQDDDTRAMYAEFLRHCHMVVDEASEGREALAKAIGRRPNVVVTETRLPGLSGFDLCRLLRRDMQASSVVVVVTGDASDATRTGALTAGADAVLVKPCLPDVLYAEIVRSQDRARALRGRYRRADAQWREHLTTLDAGLEQARTNVRRVTLRASFERRDTTSPPALPPQLFCQQCQGVLRYLYSHVGGVNPRNAEQWDYFECPSGCGRFQYRQQTRKVRRVG